MVQRHGDGYSRVLGQTFSVAFGSACHRFFHGDRRRRDYQVAPKTASTWGKFGSSCRQFFHCIASTPCDLAFNVWDYPAQAQGLASPSFCVCLGCETVFLGEELHALLLKRWFGTVSFARQSGLPWSGPETDTRYGKILVSIDYSGVGGNHELDSFVSTTY